MIAAIATCPPGSFRIAEHLHKPLPVVLLTAILLAASPPAWPLALQTRIEALSGPGWRAEDITLVLAGADGTQHELRLDIGRLSLPPPLPEIDDLVLDCAGWIGDASGWHCPALSLRAADLAGRPMDGRGRFDFTASDTGTLELSELHWDRSALQLSARIESGDAVDPHWSLAVQLDTLAPSLLAGRLALDRADGRLSGELRLDGSGVVAERAEFDLNGRDLGFDAGAGRYAGRQLAAGVSGHWSSDGGFAATLRIDRGELYLQPLYWQLAGEAPLTLELAGRRRNGGVRFERLQLNQPGVMQAGGSLILAADGALQRADIELSETGLPAFYRTYLQPWLVDTALADLDTGGRLSGRVVLTGTRIERLELRPRFVDLHDRAGRFGIEDLTGELVLNPQSGPRDSRLTWRGAQLYRIALGAGELPLSSRDGKLTLRTGTRLPVLDGALELSQLQLGGLDSALWLQFGGRLQAVSMEALSEALGWPRLAGTLAGVIPQVRYRDRRIEADGALLVKVFDGDVTAANLKLEQPFGERPELSADVELFNLDLATLTRTFDFGRIEGKLSGYVRGLRLAAWRPVQFDAFLHTPEGIESRRRISQRAVEAISNLGGSGAAGALSRGFLGLFEDFSYRRLGIRCRLADGICVMGGIAPAGEDNGYYLVEGSGLPRIDVIGYNRLVDWQELLVRLQAAARSEGPVIQ